MHPYAETSGLGLLGGRQVPSDEQSSNWRAAPDVRSWPMVLKNSMFKTSCSAQSALTRLPAPWRDGQNTPAERSFA